MQVECSYNYNCIPLITFIGSAFTYIMHHGILLSIILYTLHMSATL